MNIETTVTGPSTSAFLKELGVKFKTAYYWKNIGSGKFMLIPQTNVNPIVIKRKKNNKVKTKLKFIPSFIPAFSVGELGIIIPWGFFQKSIVFKMPGGVWQVQLNNGNSHCYTSEVEARASYLIDLLQTEQISLDEINHPEKYNAILPIGKVATAIKSEV